jgi:hypothetical protein
LVLHHISDAFLAALVVDELPKSVQSVYAQVNERCNQQKQTEQPQDAKSGLIFPIHGGIHGIAGGQAINHIENDIHEQECQGLVHVENPSFLGTNKDVGNDVERAEDLNEYAGGVRTFREKKHIFQY